MKLKRIIPYFIYVGILLYTGCNILGADDATQTTLPVSGDILDTADIVDSLSNYLQTGDSVYVDKYIKLGNTFIIPELESNDTTFIKDIIISGDTLKISILDYYTEDSTTDTTQGLFVLQSGTGTDLEGSIWRAVSLGDYIVPTTSPFMIFFDPQTNQLFSVGYPENIDFAPEFVANIFDSLANTEEDFFMLPYINTGNGYVVIDSSDTILLSGIFVKDDTLTFTTVEDSTRVSEYFTLFYGNGNTIEGSIWMLSHFAIDSTIINLPTIAPPYLIYFDSSSTTLYGINFPDDDIFEDSLYEDTTYEDSVDMTPKPDTAAILALPASVFTILDSLSTSNIIETTPYAIHDSTIYLYIIPDSEDTSAESVLDSLPVFYNGITNDTLRLTVLNNDTATIMGFTGIYGENSTVEETIWKMEFSENQGMRTNIPPEISPPLIYLDSKQHVFFSTNDM